MNMVWQYLMQKNNFSLFGPKNITFGNILTPTKKLGIVDEQWNSYSKYIRICYKSFIAHPQYLISTQYL